MISTIKSNNGHATIQRVAGCVMLTVARPREGAATTITLDPHTACLIAAEVQRGAVLAASEGVRQ